MEEFSNKELRWNTSEAFLVFCGNWVSELKNKMFKMNLRLNWYNSLIRGAETVHCVDSNVHLIDVNEVFFCCIESVGQFWNKLPKASKCRKFFDPCNIFDKVPFCFLFAVMLLFQDFMGSKTYLGRNSVSDIGRIKESIHSVRRVRVALKRRRGWGGRGREGARRLELCVKDLPFKVTVDVSPTVGRHRLYGQLLSKQDACRKITTRFMSLNHKCCTFFLLNIHRTH